MRQDFDLTSFTAGELSPRMKGRIDYARYFLGCERIQNFVVMPQGGLTRRPGTGFVARAADQVNPVRLRRFIFSTSQAYMLEFGGGYVRMYRNDGVLLNPQAITGTAASPLGEVRLTLASANGIYPGNSVTVTGIGGTYEAAGTWVVRAVQASQAVLGIANNGNGAIRVAMASTAHFINGSQVTIAGAGGTVEANGTWSVSIIDATHIDLQGSVYATAWTAGGTITGPDAFLIDLVGSVYAHAWTAGGVATATVQVPVPYAASELRQLYFTQSDDVLFITHPNHPAATLSRTSNVAWRYAALAFRDGPYLDENSTTTTLTVSGQGTSYAGGTIVTPYGDFGQTTVLNPGTASRSLTLTASSTFGINPTVSSVGTGFQASDVGRPLRVKLSASWCWMLITQVLSATQITATLQPTVDGGAWGNLDGSGWLANTYYPLGVMVALGGQNFRCTQDGVSGSVGPHYTSSGATTYSVADGNIIWEFVDSAPSSTTTFWQLGKWTPGIYPFVCCFWQQRLMLLGSSDQPNAIEGSVTGDFTNFAPTAQDGSVEDNNALSFVISDDQENAIQWVKAAGAAQAAQLAIGTVGAEDVLQASSPGSAEGATNIQVYLETAYGTAPVEPLRIGKSLIFADRPGRKILEWTFSWQVNGYSALELTQASEHITLSGVADLIYAQSPHRSIWARLANGTLLCCAYSKDQEIFGPSRQVLGGNYYGGPPIVESIDAIPSIDGSYDELWMSVLRTVGGAPLRTIEVLTRWFENASVPQENAVFVDCALSTVLPTPACTLAIAGLANTAATVDAAPSWTGSATLTASAPVFAPSAAGQVVRVNGGVLQVTTYVSATQIIALVLRPLLNLAPAASGAWSVASKVTQIGGLDHLDGETVGILGDGADLGTTPVGIGTGLAALIEPASMLTAGLPFVSAFVTMPFEPQRAAGAASSGKAKRIDTMWMRFFESGGCNFGQRLTDPLTFAQRDRTEPLLTRSAAMMMGQAPALFSGARELRPQGGYDAEAQMVVTTTSPLPLTVLAIFARADVADLPDGMK